jgi:hypothetical protein
MRIKYNTIHIIINTLPRVSALTALSSGRNLSYAQKYRYAVLLQILSCTMHGFTITNPMCFDLS